MTLCEALLKVATGTVRLAAKADIQRALRPLQFGGGVSSGPEQVIFTCRAIAAAEPELLLGKLDLSNAYGRQRRAPALWTAIQECPQIAPMLGTMWCPGYIRIRVQVSATEWKVFRMYEGLLQGELLSSPTFCLRVKRIVLDVSLWISSNGVAVVECMMYEDDIVIICPPTICPGYGGH